MENDKDWVEIFYKKLATKKYEASELIDLLGKVVKTSETEKFKNKFLSPVDKRFKTICIVSNAENNTVSQIIFIGESFSISFLECIKYASNYKQRFVIYDEKVEFVFIVESNETKVKYIVCSTDESKLNCSDEEARKLRFNNISFIF